MAQIVLRSVNHAMTQERFRLAIAKHYRNIFAIR
jgi:hypothetical protein